MQTIQKLTPLSTIHHETCPLCASAAIEKERSVKDHSITKEVFDLYRCNACDFLFTQDPPAPEEASRYYKGEEYISHSDSQEGLVNKLYHKARDFMLGQKYQLVKRASKGKRMLDYGTGTGYFTDFMQRKGYAVEGLEIDPEARAYGSQKFGITVHPPEALFKTLKADSYDVITLWHVLEHLYDPKNYLDRFHELLGEAGKLIIAVPNHVSQDARAYGADWAAYDVPRHLWHFSPATMRLMVGESGFRVTETQHMPLDPFYVSIMSQRYKSGGSLITGGLKGMTSFLNSAVDAERGSSVIYVCEK